MCAMFEYSVQDVYFGDECHLDPSVSHTAGGLFSFTTGIFSYLSLMRSFVSGQMEESITVCTQVPTVATQNDGLCLTIVMVITGRLQTNVRITLLLVNTGTVNILILAHSKFSEIITMQRKISPRWNFIYKYIVTLELAWKELKFDYSLNKYCMITVHNQVTFKSDQDKWWLPHIIPFHLCWIALCMKEKDSQ